jgi:oleandomycin transport system permease protein
MNPIRATRHALTLAWRSVTKLRHSPDQLLDVIMFPVVLVLVFVFLFGNAVAGSTHAYLQYVLPGIAVQALMFASLGIGLGLNTDLRNGIFDRFRSLPIARSAPLIGYILGDVAKFVLSLVLVFGLGAIVGFRTHGSALAILAACLLIIAFAFSVSWVTALFGLLASSPAAVTAFSIAAIMPLTFGSSVFVPTGRLPGWLQAWVKINPVTDVSNAARGLMLSLPLGSAAAASLLWALGIVVVFAPLATWAYRRQQS